MTHVQDEPSYFAEHLVTIVPDAVETQHFAIEFEEPAQLVHVARRLRRLGHFRSSAHARVWVFRIIFRSVHFDTFTFQILLHDHQRQCIKL